MRRRNRRRKLFGEPTRRFLAALPLLALAGCAPRAAATRTLHIAAGGDLQIGPRTTAGQLAALGGLLAGDLRFANLEGPLTARGAASGLDAAGGLDGAPLRFAAPPARADWLVGHLDVVSLENNHALDQGAAGRLDTVRALAERGIASALAGQPALLAGVTLLAAAFPPGFELDRETALVEAVRRAAAAGRIIVVSLHWGHTGSLLPSPAQRRLAARLVDAGAIALLGHGPHSVQGIERRGRAVVAYSLGNLALDCRCTDERDAFVLDLRVGDGRVTSARALPIEAGLAGAPPRRSSDPGLLDLLAELSRDLGSRVTLHDQWLEIE